ncbi:hypothetical protein N0V94_007128 [Neodidymelliopsis sp. IMI 364377]|nr:hypothetical protein N0V94_007128 [Neodidymelliopsis sp. IMI 364377]
MTSHAPPKLLAKQWLQAYQFAPVFVAPLVLLGASSNALLAYLTTGSSSRASSLYTVAAVAIASIVPYTALYMEPGVNGAGKWKAQELLRGEFELKGAGQGTDKDTANASAKRWAENVDMKTIAETWAKTNAWRYVITGIATVVNTLCRNEALSFKMTNPPYQRLNRDKLVAIIGDFYKFLTTFYIPVSALKYPPPEGWQNITPETTKGFPRSPIVIDLLKHLPYIDEKESRNMITNIHYKSDVVDYSTVEPHQWTEEDFQIGALSLQEWIEELEETKRENPEEEDEVNDSRDADDDEDDDDANGADEELLDHCENSSEAEEENWWDGDDPEDIKLENMIVLADGYESGGRCIVLDVFKGNIHEDMLECNLLSEVSVEQFFGDLRGKFERLEYVPVPGICGNYSSEGRFYEDVPEVDEINESLIGELGGDFAQQYKRIYQLHGWPGAAYKKEEALAAIHEHTKRREEAAEAWEKRNDENDNVER